MLGKSPHRIPALDPTVREDPQMSSVPRQLRNLWESASQFGAHLGAKGHVWGLGPSPNQVSLVSAEQQFQKRQGRVGGQEAKPYPQVHREA